MRLAAMYAICTLSKTKSTQFTYIPPGSTLRFNNDRYMPATARTIVYSLALANPGIGLDGSNVKS